LQISRAILLKINYDFSIKIFVGKTGKRATKYLRKLVAEKESDSTRLSKEDFFERIEEARKQTGQTFETVEELDKYIRGL
jgi:hypothetical protein